MTSFSTWSLLCLVLRNWFHNRSIEAFGNYVSFPCSKGLSDYPKISSEFMMDVLDVSL